MPDVKSIFIHFSGDLCKPKHRRYIPETNLSLCLGTQGSPPHRDNFLLAFTAFGHSRLRVLDNEKVEDGIFYRVGLSASR